jgi:hypothetical protein
MLEPMTVRVEVWPVAADPAGLWLVSGDDAWRSTAVMADDEPHAQVEALLWEHGVRGDVELLHSTSWRTDGPAVVLTYVAPLRCDDFVRDRWPDARPVTLGLAASVGKPPEAAPADPPAPRYVDVLLHALRHLRFLLDTDAANRTAMDEHLRRWLGELEPALAGMYERDTQAATS